MAGPIQRGGLRRYLAATRGSVAAEIAVAISALVILMLGGVELGQFVLLHQKMQRAATTVADLVSQERTLVLADVEALLDAAPHVMRPHALADNGVVLVSSVTADTSGTARVDWQVVGPGTLPATSDVGVSGGLAVLPAGLTLGANETLIVAEVRYRYTPWYLSVLGGSEPLYHRAFFRPRTAAVTSLN